MPTRIHYFFFRCGHACLQVSHQDSKQTCKSSLMMLAQLRKKKLAGYLFENKQCSVTFVAQRCSNVISVRYLILSPIHCVFGWTNQDEGVKIDRATREHVLFLWLNNQVSIFMAYEVKRDMYVVPPQPRYGARL